MAYRISSQLGFADLAVTEASGSQFLRDVEQLLDWKPIEGLLRGEVPEKSEGARPYPPLLMFRAVLLQRWYGLSDPGLQEALGDRLSFRRFVGLPLTEEAPDYSTIWRFRERLMRSALWEELFKEVTRQLDKQGRMVRSGTLLDASLIASAAKRPAEKDAKTSAVDGDARWGKKGNKSTFGYKMHAAVDETSLLVRDVEVSPANHNDCEFASGLVQGDEACVIADKAYHDKKLSQELAARGIEDGIMRRANKHHGLSRKQTQRNKRLARRRSPVEAVFGTLKRCYGLARMRCYTIQRNTTDILIGCMAYNLRRMVSLNAI